MTRRAGRIEVILLAVGAIAIVAGCGIGASGSAASVPASTESPSQTVSAAVVQTRTAIASALAAVSLQLIDADRPFRPAETARLGAAPRAVYQVILADDPNGGYIVVYEFRDAAAAVDAGNDLAGYLGSGAGRVQFPIDAQHTIRQLGTTLIWYTFSPANSPDAGSPKIAQALATLGIGFAPPR